MRLTVPRLPLVAALTLLAAAPAAGAEIQPWSVSWYRDDFVVSANGGDQSGGVALVLPPRSIPDALGLRAFTSFQNGDDVYNGVGYTATFTLTDKATGQMHSLAVSGEFDGTVTSNGVNLRNSFTGGTGSQTFDFLGRDLTVNFGFTSSGGPPLDWRGSITASVQGAGAAGPSVAPAVGPAGETAAPGIPAPAQAPEPGGVVLAALALPALPAFGLAILRRRVRRETQKD